MLFFKRKQKIGELLPPPPPDMDLELEQGLQAKPKFFDETAEPEKTHPFPEESEFTDLIDDLEGKKPAKVFIKRDRVIGKKPAKKSTAQLKEIKQLKKRIEKMELNKKAIKKSDKNLKEIIDDKAGVKREDMELPEERGIQNKNMDIQYPSINFEKPKEILEAEEEIRKAIDKIKSKEKNSFFKSFFAKKQGIPDGNEVREIKFPKPITMGNISLIQGKIAEARQLLARLDLDGARTAYMDIMEYYKNLKPEEQAKVYRDIKELYFERKNAEGLRISI